jgi:hypothetical protein
MSPRFGAVENWSHHPDVSVVAASAAPTEGKSAYKLERTGKNIVSANPPTNQQTHRYRNTRRSALRVGRDRTSTKTTTSTNADNVQALSAYSLALRISKWGSAEKR